MNVMLLLMSWRRYSFVLLLITGFGSSTPSPGSQGPMFVTEPKSVVDFANDEGALVQCVAQGSPPPAISWHLLDGTPASPIPHIRDVTPNGSLYFPPFGAESYRHDVHSAGYRCEASNAVGKIVSRDVRTRASVRQHYEVHVRDTFVSLGGTACLRCETPPSLSDHVTVTSWVQDGSYNIYPSPHAEGKIHMLPTGELFVHDVVFADGLSTFRCRTVHRVTGAAAESVQHARIIPTDADGIAKLQQKERSMEMTAPVREGGTAVLTCLLTGWPPPQYTWRQGRDHVAQTDRVHVRESVLIIQNVQLRDAGVYVCTVNNSAGVRQLEHHLIVYSPLSAHVLTPQVTVDVGRSIDLQCTVSGHPAPSVYWLKDGLPVSGSSHGSRLYLPVVTRDHRGMYQCFAKNEFSMAQVTVELRLGDAAPQLVYRFIEQTMQPGPAVSLKCIAAGNPTPRFTWLLDGFPLLHNDRLVIGQYATVHGDVVSHVNISSVHVQDGAEYRCVASNRAGESYHAARLNIYGPPIVRHMPPLTAVAGYDLRVQCPVSGYPISQIFWVKDGNVLPMNRRQEVSPNGTLILFQVDSSSDKGIYSCTARNKQGRQASQSVEIQVKVPPKIENFSFANDIQEKARVMVVCVIRSGDLPLHINWLFENGAALPEGATTQAYNEHAVTLRIDSVNARHSGNYTCQASNAAASVTHTARLAVHVPPKLAPFQFNPDLSEGVRAQISCVVEKGDPPFMIKWLKNGQPLMPEGLKMLELDSHSSTVILESLLASHAGNYTCRAENSVAYDEHTARLIVSVPPHWTEAPHDQQAPVGTIHHRLECQADGNPTPTITWRTSREKGSTVYREVSSENGVNSFSNGTLIFDRLHKDHEGFYLCEAGNGIGTVLSKRIFLTVNAPVQLLSRHENLSARLGSAATLQCHLQGDPPFKVTWKKKDLILDEHTMDYRFSQKDTEVQGRAGLSSQLHISRTVREDADTYYCVASNSFGQDVMAIKLTLQEPPDFPRNVHVIEKSSRFVKLGWMITVDGNSPITRVIAEYKTNSGVWIEFSDDQSATDADMSMKITGLKPAVTYQVRLYAENDVGRSEPGDVVEVKTDGEAPAGPPTSLIATPLSPTNIQVEWLTPDPDLCNGEILGYHVGYKEIKSSGQYIFKTFENRAHQGKMEVTLADLKKFTRYAICVQAYNALGPGPMTDELAVATLEDVPSAPPQDVRCTSANSHSIIVMWSPIPDNQLHGYLKGYKVMWISAEEEDLTLSANNMHSQLAPSSALNVGISSLAKFTNYSVQVLGYTSAGDGLPSHPINCVTQEDLPEAVMDLKAVAASGSSVILSWLPPHRANGVLTGYTVFIKPLRPMQHTALDDSKYTRYTMRGDVTQYQMDNLSKKIQYEFSVSSSTKKGEGPRSRPVTASPSGEVRAVIYSFGSWVVASWRTDVRLPCGSVGRPSPSITWRHWNQPIISNSSHSRLKIETTGELFIGALTRDDSGNYTCHVENRYGSDSIMHRLTVQVPPSAPLLHVTGTSSTSLQLQWRKPDEGGSRLRGYDLYYRKKSHSAAESNDWHSLQVEPNRNSFALKPLLCGTHYEMQIAAFNSIGLGEKSLVVKASTDGAKPTSVARESFIRPNISHATLYLDNWIDNGCPILYFEIEYRARRDSEWLLVSNSVERQKEFMLSGLAPGTAYAVRVRAHNNAGSTLNDYVFSTLNKQGTAGNAVSTTRLGGSGAIGIPGETSPMYMDMALVLPLILSVILVISGVVIYLCLVRPSRRGLITGEEEIREPAPMPNHLDNKHQREQGYATLRKHIKSSAAAAAAELSADKVPEYADDIYPYATFQLNPTSMTGDSRSCASGAPTAPVTPAHASNLSANTALHTCLYNEAGLTETIPLREIESCRNRAQSVNSEDGECTIRHPEAVYLHRQGGQWPRQLYYPRPHTRF